MEKDTKVVIAILISIILAFGVFYITVYMYVPPPYNGHVTPSASLTATQNNNSCVIVVNTPSDNDILWSDVWYSLENLTGRKVHNESQVTIPREDVVNDGAIIYISGGLAEDNEYRFIIYYNLSGGTIGYASWTQQTKKFSEIEKLVGTWDTQIVLVYHNITFFSNMPFKWTSYLNYEGLGPTNISVVDGGYDILIGNVEEPYQGTLLMEYPIPVSNETVTFILDSYEYYFSNNVTLCLFEFDGWLGDICFVKQS